MSLCLCGEIVLAAFRRGCATIAALGGKTTWLLLGAVTLLLAGATLRSTTQALFVAQAIPTENTFNTALIEISISPTGAISVTTGATPSYLEAASRTVTSSSTVGVNQFFTAWADISSVLDTDASGGLQVVVLRCGTETSPADCNAATTFETVTGVMDATGTIRVTTSPAGPPNAGAVVASGTTLVFGGGNVTATTTIGGVPVLTKNSPNTQAKCSLTLDGGCPLGGYASVTVTSASSTIQVGSHTVTTPPVTNGNALGAAATGLNADHLLIYLFLPSTSTATTYASQSSDISLTFTAVQPKGSLNPNR